MDTHMTDDGIRSDIADGVIVISLDRPPVNALDRKLMEAITATFDALNDSSDVRAAVLTGTGRVFCAGADMKARAGLDSSAGDTSAHSRRAREMLNSILECRVPVIAAVNGPALGGGLSLVASCDLVVASERAEFGLPEIDVGLLGGGRHAMRFVGAMRARRMMLTGDRLSAQDLYRVGAIDWCEPADSFLQKAVEIARSIAAKSPAAVRLAKRALNIIESSTVREGYRLEQDFTVELSKHPDSLEAAAAFREKRLPRFAPDSSG